MKLLRNCFNCVHKKTDLWNYNYSDKEAHSCEKGHDNRMHEFRKRCEGLTEDEVRNDATFVMECHELSEHQKRMDKFIKEANSILDELKQITDK
jgi:hypothetical protein